MKAMEPKSVDFKSLSLQNAVSPSPATSIPHFASILVDGNSYTTCRSMRISLNFGGSLLGRLAYVTSNKT